MPDALLIAAGRPKDALGGLKEQGQDGPGIRACQAVLRAIQSKDPNALYAALREVHDICASGGNDEPDADGDDAKGY